MSTKLSIVTINLNNLIGLKKTVESIRLQQNKNFEYIIKDGGSTDGSIEFIENNLDVIDKYIVCSDTGIYNAFNQGIESAKYDYIHLLNSGDIYINKYCIDRIYESMVNDFICFSVFKFRRGKPFVWVPQFNNTFDYVDCAHPGLIVHKNIYRDKKYNINYKIVSDSLFIYNNVKNFNTHINNDILVYMEDEGISSKVSIQHEIEKHKSIFIDDYKSEQKFFTHIKIMLNFFLSIFNKYVK